MLKIPIYAKRRGDFQDVRVCEAVFRDIEDGRVMNDATARDLFGGRFPNTEFGPKEIAAATLGRLMTWLGLPDLPELRAHA